MIRSGKEGEILHAKHAFRPNSLGYCGPDENGRILDFLHGSSDREGVLETLGRFEAAYPFIRMIAKATGRDTYDPEVTEAYWIGNALLDQVAPPDFFEFSHQGLKSRMKKDEAKRLFKGLGGLAKPHHTFYVLGIYSKTTSLPTVPDKLLSLMDSCRISWGEVLEVKDRSLVVARSPLRTEEGRLELSGPQKKEIAYDREIPPFDKVKSGDWVSIHWDFASERLSPAQLRNIRTYSSNDVDAANRYADLLRDPKQLRR